MKLKSIKTERLYLKVADQIAGQIRAGNIKRDHRLPSERDLAEMFGVSRPTIREAMIALEIAGMVSIRSGSGVYVKSAGNPTSLLTDAPGPMELLEARLYFEADAAALAATRRTDEDMQLIEQAFMELSDESHDISERELADENFHIAIAKASGNSAIHGVIEHLWMLRKTTEISKFFHNKMRDQGVAPINNDHRMIVDAIREGDADGARVAMFQHLKNVMNKVTEKN